MSDPRRAALTDLLARYAPRNEEEQGHLARMGALLEQAHPFSRHHATPGHFTASAFVLSPAGDALYLIHHKKLGRWLQPGGHIEPDDSDLLAAARREVLEEVGLAGAPLLDEARPVFDVDVHGIPAHKGEPAPRALRRALLLSRAFPRGPRAPVTRWRAAAGAPWRSSAARATTRACGAQRRSSGGLDLRGWRSCVYAQITGLPALYQPSSWSSIEASMRERLIFKVGVNMPFSTVKGSLAMTNICSCS
jgi:8-oxo-dGTP pyrophosphatase MutT (NUDIX family)